MKTTVFAMIMGLLIGSQAFASVRTGRYTCERNGQVIREITVTSTKLGHLELPVLDFTNPKTGASISGIGTIIELEHGTNYLLNQNASLFFQNDGRILSEDTCKKVN